MNSSAGAEMLPHAEHAVDIWLPSSEFSASLLLRSERSCTSCDDHYQRRRGRCGWKREIGSAAAIPICRAAAEEPVLEAQGGMKSEGRACAKVFARLRSRKGPSAGLLIENGGLRVSSAPSSMGRRPIDFGIGYGPRPPWGPPFLSLGQM